MSTRIRRIVGWEALDSRGKPTVAARLELEGGGVGRVVVPSGASTGSHEAAELRDGGARYAGNGVLGAVANVNGVLARALAGADAADQEALDARLEDLDGTPDLRRLGANAVLAVSLAALLAVADGGTPLWEPEQGGPPELPLPMVNILSGGAHAGGAIDIQDVLAVPLGASSFAEALEWAARVRAVAARLVERNGGTAALVADEGGLACVMASNEQALALVAEAIAGAGLRPGSEVALAVDVAANELAAGDGLYRLPAERRELSTGEWMEEVAGWCDRYPLVSVEDPLAEDDWAGWSALCARLGAGCQLIGDDLFATQPSRLERGIAAGAANAVLVKVNQAGTVSRARRAAGLAAAAGWATVVSARSGDTEDGWLADLAVRWGAGQVKVGSLTRSERTAKWNRLLEIEATVPGACFVGARALAGLAGTAGSP